MTVKIQLKGKEIEFNDIVELDADQLALILAQAGTKTQTQWLRPSAQSVKIRLTPAQKATVLEHKNNIVKGHIGESLINENLIRFTEHSLGRIADRVDEDAFPSPESLIGMADLLVNTQKLQDDADWRGYERLSYSFEGEYDDIKCTVAVVFDGQMVVVTIITPEKRTRSTFTIGAQGSKLEEQLKKARVQTVLNHKNRKNRKIG